MGSFGDFIRYGLPGYNIGGSVVLFFAAIGFLPEDDKFYENFGAVLGALFLALGPLIGFLVHQIYFVYFDIQETYTRRSRKCLDLICRNYERSDAYVALPVDMQSLERLASLSWILLTTNFQSDSKIDELYITRLRSLRNYSHAFGAIIASALFAAIVGLVFLLISPGSWSAILPIVLGQAVLSALFLFKRREVTERIDDFEVSVALFWKDRFVKDIHGLIELEVSNAESLQEIGRKVACLSGND